ncbi:MAG TPA: pyrophosphate--fructose-6-phosphate 1-phosphotransferase [Gemmatimonadales bacterium]|jgi:pyrophosphate--fructose-6-phosphate 1-phosphotransferase
MPPRTVGILTAGGLAPCLSSAIGALIQRYTVAAPGAGITCYVNGYQGLLTGKRIDVTPAVRAAANRLHHFGGSPIGNSRVKLTNIEDCLRRGLIKEGDDPQDVAAAQLMRDQVDILHTIGGDDTNTAAATLASFLADRGHRLTVVGLPKTVDNDVYPVRQSLGAATAAEQGARFFANVVAEQSANPRMLIVHEVMGRDCGWLTAATARAYRRQLADREFLPELGLSRQKYDIHGVYLPEMAIDFAAESSRLRAVMDRHDCVNLFIAEGAGVGSIVRELESAGDTVPRDAFGHVKLDAINPGAWFAKHFAARLGAEKTLVQKSGYFARAAAPNTEDLELIRRTADRAVECALGGVSGVVGEDEDRGGALRAIEFERIRGGKPFDLRTGWWRELLDAVGQPPAHAAASIPA